MSTKIIELESADIRIESKYTNFINGKFRVQLYAEGAKSITSCKRLVPKKYILDNTVYNIARNRAKLIIRQAGVDYFYIWPDRQYTASQFLTEFANVQPASGIPVGLNPTISAGGPNGDTFKFTFTCAVPFQVKVQRGFNLASVLGFGYPPISGNILYPTVPALSVTSQGIVNFGTTAIYISMSKFQASNVYTNSQSGSFANELGLVKLSQFSGFTQYFPSSSKEAQGESKRIAFGQGVDLSSFDISFSDNFHDPVHFNGGNVIMEFLFQG